MLGFSFCRIRPWTAEDALNKRELLAGNNNNNNNNNKKRNSIVGNDCMVSNLSIGATRKKKPKVRKKLREPRFCFKTMSDVDVLDDGYKWRKYGQKVVKDTQHPRDEQKRTHCCDPIHNPCLFAIATTISFDAVKVALTVGDLFICRSYYRCTQGNCRVKKRIERLAEDPRMVITTYEGRHAHSPSHHEEEESSQASSSSKLNLFWQ
ncbi:hypothetical protein B296_00050455 [Ensete ventricosum]|uniref:WRKY domain-containing protein n=1 Tax=Ensete ventricosum TaxID=4639 RepID=A0A426XJR9_ENSVE|nr:hypothetical protein B296_00050455 [Ensete ventricosum]